MWIKVINKKNNRRIAINRKYITSIRFISEDPLPNQAGSIITLTHTGDEITKAFNKFEDIELPAEPFCFIDIIAIGKFTPTKFPMSYLAEDILYIEEIERGGDIVSIYMKTHNSPSVLYAQEGKIVMNKAKINHDIKFEILEK